MLALTSLFDVVVCVYRTVLAYGFDRIFIYVQNIRDTVYMYTVTTPSKQLELNIKEIIYGQVFSVSSTIQQLKLDRLGFQRRSKVDQAILGSASYYYVVRVCSHLGCIIQSRGPLRLSLRETASSTRLKIIVKRSSPCLTAESLQNGLVCSFFAFTKLTVLLGTPRIRMQALESLPFKPIQQALLHIII